MPGLSSVAVQAAARLLSRTWVAPMTAMRWPLTVVCQARWASPALQPTPTTGNFADRAAASESRRPTGPKSRPWLLAMVATSTPASLRAVRAAGGARKVKSLGAGVPRSVMAVSRLTTARSARRRTPAMGPKVVAGLVASRDPIAPSKWTSPPKAMVTGSPVGSLVPPAVGRRVVVVAAGAAWPGSPPASHADSDSSAARVRVVTTWRRWKVRGWGGRGTADSRVRRSGKRRLGSHAVAPPCQGGSAAQARVQPARPHGVAARRPRRADDPADQVVGPGGNPGRPDEPSEAPARPALAPPLGGPYLPVLLGVGVQLGDALVADQHVQVLEAHDLSSFSNTSEQSTLVFT